LKKELQDTEAELIRRCQQNDRQAQSKLYHRYSRGMLNVAYRILKHKEDAQDVLQESFLKAFRELDKLQNINGFGGWLKRIVVNTAINQLKKKGLDLVDMSHAVENHAADIATNQLPYEWDLQQARKALMQLPDGYRTVLTLYLIEGYDHEEISQILGISKNTSLTQFSRGKKRLQQLVAELKTINK